ncbi:MAG: DUF4293 family protein [Bacteroidales bacterium]|nr:DUF4293 family protein [Bacteroidales bacterium]
MWQRIQTLYLVVALGLLVAMFWHLTFLWWLILLGVACFMQLVAVLAYKFRLFQMRTAIIAAIMLLGLQIWMAVVYLTGDKAAFNITAVFPVVAAILDGLAARAIFSDELIVRSSSRLRSSKRKH